MEPVALGEREYHLFEYMLGSGLVRGGGGGGYCARHMSWPLYPGAMSIPGFPWERSSPCHQRETLSMISVHVIVHVVRMPATWPQSPKNTIKSTMQKPFLRGVTCGIMSLEETYKSKRDLHGAVRSHLIINSHVVDLPLGV